MQESTPVSSHPQDANAMDTPVANAMDTPVACRAIVPMPIHADHAYFNGGNQNRYLPPARIATQAIATEPEPVTPACAAGPSEPKSPQTVDYINAVKVMATHQSSSRGKSWPSHSYSTIPN